jgi:hypothetical protein
MKGKPVTGKGYVELVGYEKPLIQDLPDSNGEEIKLR